MKKIILLFVLISNLVSASAPSPLEMLFAFDNTNPKTTKNCQRAGVRIFLFKCPLTEGNAAYQARTLLQIIRQQFIEFTNSCDSDKPSGKRLSNTNSEGDTFIDEIAESFSLFPNPNNGEFVLAYHLQDINEATININDITGKVVYTGTITNLKNLVSINIENLQSGMYFIQLNNKGNLLWSNKLMINK